MKRNFFKRTLAVVLCLTLLDVSNLTALATDENSIGTVATVSGADAGSTAPAEDNASATVSDGNAAAGSGILAISETAVPLAAAVPVAGKQEVELTINHYLTKNGESTMLFAPSAMTVKNGDTVSVARSGEYYTVSSVKVDGNEAEEKDGGFELKLGAAVKEAVVDVYYQETFGTYRNETSMIDYDNGWSWTGDSSSISYSGNYSAESTSRTRMGTIGTRDSYETLIEMQDSSGKTYHFNINDYYRYNYVRQRNGAWRKDTSKDYRAQFPILTGLLKGLSKSEGSSVYDVVEFAYDDPGFFSMDAKAGKRILNGYSLEFNRNGMNYELVKVWKDDEVVCSDLSSFFPVGSDFFGMRYDFSFTTGDYVGDMTYSFVGDDDLWVCLDGEVILDLGGIHDAYPAVSGRQGKSNEVSYAPGSVDVWSALLGKADYTLQEKIDYVSDAANANRAHTVTVLFMERGSNQSNCNMAFVMPNIAAESAVVSTVTKAALQLSKKDASDGSVMAGVSFTLTDGNGYRQTLSTDANGKVSFSGLTEGIYTLSETAPEGYLEAGPWTVLVTAQSTTGESQTRTVHSIAEVKDSVTGETLNASDGVYTIENTKDKPQIRLEQSKTAHPVDWDARIYRLTLTATSLTESTRKNAQTGEGEKLSVTADVVDYIDARFVVTDAAGNELAAGAEIRDNAGVNGSLKKDADENWYVEWTEVTVAPKGEDNSAGWSAELYVRAREEFIGGNMIPTNGPDSGVIVGEELYPFEKPTVNVKLLNLQLEDKEITLFLGEEVKPGDYLTELKGTLQVLSIEDEAVALQDAPVLSGEELAELLEEKTQSVTYGGAEDEMGTFTYTLSQAADWKNHTADRVGEAVERYTLTVSYTAYTEAERAEIIGADYKAPEMEQTAGSVWDEGVYTVNVVAGKLTITKKLDTSDIDFTQGDPVFTFKITKDGRFYGYCTVRFTKAMLDAGRNEVTVAVLEGLAKGTYSVEEAETMRYELSEVTAGGTVSASTKDGAALFEMGMVTGADGAIRPAEAKAAFTNTKNNDNNFSDTDVVVNSFVIGADATISWTADTLQNR